MLNFTVRQEFDFHTAYPGVDKTKWCLFCRPFTMRDIIVNQSSLQRGGAHR